MAPGLQEAEATATLAQALAGAAIGGHGQGALLRPGGAEVGAKRLSSTSPLDHTELSEEEQQPEGEQALRSSQWVDCRDIVV
jgi:hypothetical protein